MHCFVRLHPPSSRRVFLVVAVLRTLPCPARIPCTEYISNTQVNPTDVDALHRLGLARYSQAKLLENSESRSTASHAAKTQGEGRFVRGLITTWSALLHN